MKNQCLVSVAGLVAAAGLAVAQPTVDGVFDPGTEASFYGDILWTNPNPTNFGDNSAGLSIAGDAGNPSDVATGIEIQIPLAELAGATSFDLAGWVTSGDRSFMSNQIIHDGTLPPNTGNIGNTPNFETDARFPGSEFVPVTVPAAGAAPTLDGTRDGVYTDVFVQTNFTGFGDNGDATVTGGGGSEIDRVSVASDGTSLYIFVAGNLESNGNGLDLYIDLPTVSVDVNDLSSASAGGAGGGFPNSAGVVFDAGFGADLFISVDGDGTDVNLFAGDLDDDIDLEVSASGGYGVAAVDAGYGVSIDNSNVEGVPGSPIGTTPVSPAANFAYGSEMNNLRGQIDADAGLLYLFVGANLNVGFEKMSFFFDVAPGGQNEMRDDNVDISFGGLNAHAGLTFDAGFEADYWFNINNGLDGGTTLINFMDAAVLRTDGPLFDLFTGVILDYGAFFGGNVASFDGTPDASPVEVIDFSGPQIDIQDGTLAGLFTQFAPRTAQFDPFAPVAGLVQGAIDNSNVGGVTDSAADASAVNAVNNGVELVVDLNELGWDGTSEIRVAAWIAGSDFNTVSNQGLGFPAGTTDNLTGDPTPDMPDSGDEVALGDVDFNTLAGDQFIVVPLAGAGPMGCNVADVALPFDVLDLGDVDAFIAAFLAGDALADIAPPAGVIDLDDVDAFIAAFLGGCP
ncbi:MAG: GC-type dockerin domain-anchored protein [Planctomycetota bacterium]